MRKPKGRSTAEAGAAKSRVLAIHRDVSGSIDSWASAPAKAHFAARLQAIFVELRAGSEDQAEMLLKNAMRCAVKGADGNLLELGPNAKGGAPRAFVLRRYESYFFVAACVEEGQRGCRCLPDAKSRARDICLWAQPPASLRDYQKLLTHFSVESITPKAK